MNIEERSQPVLDKASTIPSIPNNDSVETTLETKTFVPATHNLWIIPIPVKKRYHPDRNFQFGLGLNLLFGFAATFTVANLYYNQPLLSILADDWGVQYDDISRVPTLLQCGYAVGILLLAPLGDMVRRRGLVLLLIALTATLSIGLALAPNLITFEVLGFFIAVLTVSAPSADVDPVPLNAEVWPDRLPVCETSFDCVWVSSPSVHALSPNHGTPHRRPGTSRVTKQSHLHHSVRPDAWRPRRQSPLRDHRRVL